MAWLFVSAQRVRSMSAEEANAVLQATITHRRRTYRAAVASGPVLSLVAVATLGLSWWLVPTLLAIVFLGGGFKFWAWHSYRSACVLGACGYARDALVGRWVAQDNVGFGPHR